ncbi:MAG: hypothetical protein MPJ50_05155 [Pirellulales bacterium]|nr:hypothetical protein [Pirellulales bacterium]
MIGLILDALVLMVLLKVFNDDEGSFWVTLLLALGASVVAYVLALTLVSVIGIGAILVAGVATGVLLSVCISAVYGVEIKRSFLIAGIFVVVHIGIGMAFSAMLNT